MENREALNPFSEANNKHLLDELCMYISNNFDSNNTGWTELVAQSNLSHTKLQFLFNKHL